MTWVTAALLYGLGSVARLLGQAAPTPLGAAVAATALPLVVIVDALYKRIVDQVTRRGSGAIDQRL